MVSRTKKETEKETLSSKPDRMRKSSRRLRGMEEEEPEEEEEEEELAEEDDEDEEEEEEAEEEESPSPAKRTRSSTKIAAKPEIMDAHDLPGWLRRSVCVSVFVFVRVT